MILKDFLLIYEKQKKRYNFLNKIFNLSGTDFISSHKTSKSLLEKLNKISNESNKLALIFIDLDDYSVLSIIKILDELRNKETDIEVVFICSKGSIEKFKMIKKKTNEEYLILTGPVSPFDCEQLVLKTFQNKRKEEKYLKIFKGILDSNNKKIMIKDQICLYLEEVKKSLGLEFIQLVKIPSLKNKKAIIFFGDVGQKDLEHKGLSSKIRTEKKILRYHEGRRFSHIRLNQNHFLIFGIKKNIFQESQIFLESFSKCLSFLIKSNDLFKELPLEKNLFDLGQGVERIIYDIRDSVNTIKTISHLIRNGKESSPYVIKMQDVIYNSCDDFFSLISDLKDFQEIIQAKNIRTHKVESIFSFLEKKYSFLLNIYDIDLELKYNKSDKINCDIFKIKRILSYLVNCTKKELIQDEVPSPKIVISYEEREDTYEFILKNNNKGLTKERLSVLFEPFSFDEDDDHSGLGYLMVKQIIESHNGLIEARTSSWGLDFLIKIPKSVLENSVN
jgi:signal transduction histidine kinase